MELHIEDILMEDDDILVVRKNAGVAVQHAGSGKMDLEHMLLNYLAGKTKGGRSLPYLAVIHRLDQPVEGILVFAKTAESAKSLNNQIQQNKFRKEYLAVAEHVQGASVGKLEDYLLKTSKGNFSKVVEKGVPGCKRAELEYQVIEECGKGGKALIRILLKTGRHHQIRVQMAHASMPLCGDRKYNSEYVEHESLALCAYRLAFYHPRTKRLLMFQTIPQNQLFGNFRSDLSDGISEKS